MSKPGLQKMRKAAGWKSARAFDAAFAVARPSSDEGNVSEMRVRREA